MRARHYPKRSRKKGFPKVYVTSVLPVRRAAIFPACLEYYIAYQRVATGRAEEADRDANLSDHSGGGGDRHRDLSGHLRGSQFAKLYADMNVICRR